MSIIRAIKEGDVSTVDRIVRSGMDPNRRIYMGATYLMIAAVGGHTDMVRFFLEKGADVNAVDDMGRSTLVYEIRHPPVMRLLLEAGADPNSESAYGRTALINAVDIDDVDITRLLLDYGADIEMRSGTSPLELALERGSEDMVNLLLDRGADTNVLDRDGITPLARCVEDDMKFIPSLLAHGADVNMVSLDGMSPLELALLRNNLRVARLLLEAGANPDVRERYLVRVTNSAIVRLLLEYGADPDTEDRGRYGSLLTRWVSKGDIDTVRLILEKGANVDKEDDIGITPLIVASMNSDVDMITLLLDYRADPGLRMWGGHTATDMAKRDDIRNLINIRARSMKDVKARSRSYMDDSYHDLGISFSS